MQRQLSPGPGKEQARDAHLVLRALSCVLNLAACVSQEQGSRSVLALGLPTPAIIFATHNPSTAPYDCLSREEGKYAKFWERTNSPISRKLVSHAAVLVQRVNISLFGGLLGCAAYARILCSALLHSNQRAAQLPEYRAATSSAKKKTYCDPKSAAWGPGSFLTHILQRA